MRESAVLLLVAGIVAWIGVSRWESIAPRVGSPSDRTSHRSSANPSGGIEYETSRIGPDISASAATRPAKAEKYEASDSSSKKPTGAATSEDEELPTIYSGQIESQVEEHSAKSAKRPGPSARKSKPKMVFGVPLESWILSRRHRVAEAPVGEEEGLRVYLQCLELTKKESRGLEKNRCRALLANRHFPEPVKGQREAYY